MVSKNSLGKKILTYLVIVIALAAFIFPIYWMFIASFKENSILMRVPPQLYPTFKTIDNYISIITNTKYLNYIKNSFVIISDTDDTFNFVVSILYTQLFNLLCDKADDVYGGRLPVHVRCLLDEFANIGQIPKFEKLIATMRSREISASIILQSQSQLKAIYKDNADTIVGNCDTTLFLGGKEKTTLKEISEILGKETIDSFNTSETRGRELSHGLNYQKLGKTYLAAAKWKISLKTLILSSCSIRQRATGLSLQSSSTSPRSR